MAEGPMDSYPWKKHRVCKSREEIDVKMEEIDAKKDEDRDVKTGRVISFSEKDGYGHGWIELVSNSRYKCVKFLQQVIKCEDPDYMGVLEFNDSVEYVLDESTNTVAMVTLAGGAAALPSTTNRRNTLPTPTESPPLQNSEGYWLCGDYVAEEVLYLEKLERDRLLMDSEKQNTTTNDDAGDDELEEEESFFFGGDLARRNADKATNYADDVKHKATVTWFSEEKGYGLLQPESGPYDELSFLQMFIKCDDLDYMGVLHADDPVEYVLDEPSNIVLMVTLPGGASAPPSTITLINPPCVFSYSNNLNLDAAAGSSKH